MASTDTQRDPNKGIFKRLLIGRAVASSKMEHTLLPKSLALPVFSSDALSSVAYATEEMLFVLLGATTLAGASKAYPYLMPITIAVSTLLAIVIASYRQTVRAYPKGGGAYIVAKENFGKLSGLVAGAALLTDYILTVAVSVTAGVLAITSAFDGLSSFKVPLCLGFIAFITVMNIRGVKESGSIFAIPTYGFIFMIMVTVGAGLAQCFLGSGCPQAPDVEPSHHLPTVVTGITLFVILKAFASGATALTGVEAISDGVQAFRRPQAKNAAATLAIMGSISITMFLGISFLAANANVIKGEEMTVVAQIAAGVYNQGFLFYVVQFFTAAILILAANTAYQDFPRLSSIIAADHFMPRQFMNRGDRLVFSNGIVGLALAAAALIWIFDANLETLIHLYVLGVFISFTMSQGGMIRRWFRLARAGDAPGNWKRSVTINIIGCTTTGVVLIIVLVTKFGFPHPGVWMVMVAIAFIVVLMLRINTHYTSVQRQLHDGAERPMVSGRNHVVLIVTGMGPATAEALGYIRSFSGQEFHPIWLLESGSAQPDELRREWADFASGAPELEVLEVRGGIHAAARAYVRGIEREDGDFITVVIPELVRYRLLIYLLRRRKLIRLKAQLLEEDGVVVTDAPVLAAGDDLVGVDGRSWIANRTEALVFVSGINDASIRAVNYALTLRASRTRVIHFALDTEHSADVLEQWAETGYAIPLEMVEAPFRDLTDPMLEEVRSVTQRPDTIAAVVIPEMVLPTWRHMLLHNQNALFVKRLFLYEPRVVLTSVPYLLQK